MKSSYLVIGGTGKTGRKVVDILKNNNKNVRVAGRNSTPLFDWEKPSTWREVLAGISKMYIVYYPDLAVPGAYEAISQLISLAKEMEIQKIVLLSGKGEKEAERCETIVEHSGIDYTLVRASWFNQNFSESFLLNPILAGHVALPMPNAKIPFVDTDDIAEVVAEVLMNDSHNNKTYEITGPEALTFEQAVATIAKHSGRSLLYQPISLEAHKSLLQSAGLPETYVWLLDYLFREVLGNDKNQIVTNHVEQVLGRAATNFDTYAKRIAQTGIWNQKIPAFI